MQVFKITADDVSGPMSTVLVRLGASRAKQIEQLYSEGFFVAHRSL